MEGEIIQKEDDLQLIADPGFTKKKYFLLCESKHVYIKLEKIHYLILEKLFPLLNGQYEIETIKEEMANQGIKAEIVDKSLEFLRKKGILKNSDVPVYNKVEMEMSSRKVLEFQINHFFERYTRLYRIIYWCFVFITIALIVFGTVFGRFGIPILQDSFQGYENFQWNHGKVIEIIILILCFIASTFLHEMGHIITAIAMGITPKSFTLLLRMGILPVFYIRYKDYYSIASFKRILVSFGGMWINILHFLICWILLSYVDSWILAALLVYNIGICLSCFTLLGTSDGYYIVATLFNIEGFRWSMLKTIGTVLYNKGSYKIIFKEVRNYIYLGYFIASYGFTFISLYSIGMMTVNFMNFNFIHRGVILLFVFGIILLNVISTMRKFFHSLKKMSFNQ